MAAALCPMTFTSDELILALVSLVRATHPTMLRQEADGFAVDFEPLERKEALDPDERLLLKMRTALEAAGEGAPAEVHLDLAESQRLINTLAGLEALQPWPVDVLNMSRNLRARLLTVTGKAQS
jgi:hypothetical protein